jgi:tryptophan synthase alpha chain
VPSRITEAFASLKSAGKMAFMPFLTAGDPDLETTQAVIRRLAAEGVDLIEVGFPYSDPIADGPVIQSSYTRALERKLHVREIFTALAELKGEQIPPLVGMVSYAIIFRTGIETFLDHCVESGVSGLIVPDLPGDEAAELFEQTREHGLDLVQLIAPTTPRERARRILQSCSGFVYCIAVAGTTGEREHVAEALLDRLRWLREETDLPLAVGFGISRPEHVDPLRGLADGVIVGSAIVRHFQGIAEGERSVEEALEEIGRLAARMTTSAGQGS